MGIPVPSLLSGPSISPQMHYDYAPQRRDSTSHMHYQRSHTPNPSSTSTGDGSDEGQVLVLNFAPSSTALAMASSASGSGTVSAGIGVLDCAVVGTDSALPYFHVVTRPGVLPGHWYTAFRTNDGRPVARVEWAPEERGQGQYGTQVELRFDAGEGGFGRQSAAEWLNLAEDGSYRIMYAHGYTYVWVPRADSICLYHWDPRTIDDAPELLARIVKDEDLVLLQISLDAIDADLLEMCVVCVVLFQSGRRID